MTYSPIQSGDEMVKKGGGLLGGGGDFWLTLRGGIVGGGEFCTGDGATEGISDWLNEATNL